MTSKRKDNVFDCIKQSSDHIAPRVSVLRARKPGARQRGRKTRELGNEVVLGFCDVSFDVFPLCPIEFYENRKFFVHF